MTLLPNTLKKNIKARKKRRRVGRGDASSGTYSGRGMKGQRSRSGGKSGLARRAFKQNLINLPKNRGFNSPRGSAVTVTLATLERVVTKENELIAPNTLLKKGVIATIKSGVKIVARGELTKKIEVKGIKVSVGAKAAIEKAGGTVAPIVKKKKAVKKAKPSVAKK